MDILKFHRTIRSRFGLLSFAYLTLQRFNLLELQMDYLKCCYDVQETKSAYVQQKWFNGWYVSCITAITTIHMIPKNNEVL